MQSRGFIFALLPAVLLLSSGANARDEAGVIDYSAEGLLSGENFTQRFNSKFSFDRLNFSCTASRSNGLDAGDESLSWLEDWRPWQSGFRLSAGLLYQQQNLDFQCNSQPFIAESDSVDYGDVVGSEVMPYMGLGWNRALLSQDQLGINVDFGFLYGGGVSDRLPDGAYRPWRFEPAGSDYLKDLEELELRPVFSLGVSYSF